jgi:hypothetical protein
MLARMLLTPLVVALLSAPAIAGDVERYSLERTDDGFVRMDLQTGQMSICTERANQLVCRPAADERDAYRAEIDALESRLEILEERMARLEEGSLVRPEAVLPDDEEFERTLSRMERFLRSFMGIAREFEREDQPDRT